MPILALILFILVILVVGILLVPLSIVQRYRVGTRRQQARGWLIGINVFGMALSALMFLVGSAVSNFWIPNAFRYSGLGILAGCALGILGLLLTKWEPSPRALHFTPNRFLVLAITLTIAGRSRSTTTRRHPHPARTPARTARSTRLPACGRTARLGMITRTSRTVATVIDCDAGCRPSRSTRRASCETEVAGKREKPPSSARVGPRRRPAACR